MSRIWKTSRRAIEIHRPLVMGILNVTPDSFSDGGHHLGPDAALERVEAMARAGADIIDVGGESTRPGSSRVPVDEEIRRTAGIIEAVAKRYPSIPISIDTTKLDVAAKALDQGAEIINDISGLRFEEELGKLAADTGAGLILMHSRGDFDQMHSVARAADILEDVRRDFLRSTSAAAGFGVKRGQIVLDVGIGFGKSYEQNLELINKLDKLISEFAGFPFLVGLSRKSFIGKLLGGDVPPEDRVTAGAVLNAMAVSKGASIIRTHDIRSTVDALATVAALDLTNDDI